jgi:hypothetical protein
MLEPGVIVQGYRIDSVLGVGGMGAVYEAFQLSLERTVALKLISPELGSDPGFQERFRREGLIQAQLDHPHIVPVYEAGESEHGLFIAMRLIRGRNLKDLITSGELGSDGTRKLLGQVAGALDSAHEVGLTHRDVKPANILVDVRRNHAYLADFGVTKARGRPNLTRTGEMVGTLDYIAPEQILGNPATNLTDIYALGAVAFECFAGTVPFPRATEAAVLYAHLSDEPPSLLDHRQDLPEELDAVLRRAMAKEPVERYQTAMAMIDDIDRAFAGATMARPIGQETPATVGDQTMLAGSAGTAAPPKTPPPATHAAPPPDETLLAPTTPPPAAATPTPATQPAGEDTILAATPPPATTQPGAPETQLAAGAPPTQQAAGPPAVAPAAAGGGAAAIPAEPGRPALGWRPLAALGLVAVLAGLGFLVGRLTHKKASATASSAALHTGKIGFTYPVGWQRLAKPPTVPYLPLKGAVAVSHSGVQTDGLVVGTQKMSWPYTLPIGFIGHEVAQTSTSYSKRGYVVAIGPLQAFRLSGVKLSKKDKTLYTVFWLPQPGTTETPTAVCISKTGSTKALLDCEALVGTLTISGSTLYELAPSSTYASSLDSALGKLEKPRSSGLSGLARAGSASAQASAARSIASAYATARSQVAKSKPPEYAKPANDKIVSALGGAASAYRSLSSAASAGSYSRYASASRSVASAEKRFRAAVSDLNSLGYSVS